jgi:glycosyltransferase involved in cell wall biosynthesis
VRPPLSAVVISRNEGAWLGRTVASLRATLPEGSEILVVDDGSAEAPARAAAPVIRTRGLGVARARNQGARHARGEILAFCDAHMRFDPACWRLLLDALDEVDAVAPAVASTRAAAVFGYGLTLPAPDLVARWMLRRRRRPFAAPVLPGCCFVIRRESFERAGGFDEGLRGRGGVDVETSMRLWMLGRELRVVPEARVWHAFRQHPPYRDPEVEATHNRLRAALVHLRPARLARVIEALAADREGAEALLLALAGDVAGRRAAIISAKKRDDNWFFKRFGIRWKP